jgi:hypothetical protein
MWREVIGFAAELAAISCRVARGHTQYLLFLTHFSFWHDVSITLSLQTPHG